MSMINKMAVIGLVSLGGVVALAGTSVTANAGIVRDTCNGQVTIADTYRADPNDGRNLVLNPGERAGGQVGLNGFGWIRWFCNDGVQVTEHRADCMDEADAAVVAVRFRLDGHLQIACH